MKADFKNIVYNYLSDKVDYPNLTYQKRSSKLLEDIILISKKHQSRSNNLQHAILYIYDTYKNFSNTYSVSSEIFSLIELFEEEVILPIKEKGRSIQRLKSFSNDKIKTTPLNWVTNNHKSLLINFHNDYEVITNLYFVEKERIIKLNNQEFDFTFLIYNVSKIMDFFKKHNLTIPSNWLLITPILKSISTSKLTDVSGLGMLFIGKEINIENDKTFDFSFLELREILKTLSLLSEVASDYHTVLEIERNQILQGLKDLHTMFLHSFGSYGSRISDIYEDNNGNPLPLNESKREELMKIRDEIEKFKMSFVKKIKNIEFTPIKLDYIIRKLLKSDKIKNLIKYNNVIFEYYFRPEKDVRVFLDEKVINEVFVTIFDNSIKAITSLDVKGKIIIEVLKTEDDVKIYISDNGIGITKDKNKKGLIFSTESASLWTDRNKRGAGTGLFLCRVLLSLFKAKIKFLKKSRLLMSTSIEISIPIPKDIN